MSTLDWKVMVHKKATRVIPVAILLAVVLIAVGARPAGATNISVPAKISEFILKSRGALLARSILEAQGYKCLPFGVSCWIEGSYDPPRWGRGTVDTGGAGYYLNARGWSATDAPVIRTFPNNWRLVIFCQTQGPPVYGRWGWTTVWDYVGQYGDAPMFVSDGFVNTGTNGYVAGDCKSTNYGDG